MKTPVSCFLYHGGLGLRSPFGTFDIRLADGQSDSSCEFYVINRPLCEGLARETASKMPRQLMLVAHEAVLDPDVSSASITARNHQAPEARTHLTFQFSPLHRRSETLHTRVQHIQNVLKCRWHTRTSASRMPKSKSLNPQPHPNIS